MFEYIESAENTHFGICQGQSYLLTKTQKVNISDASNACDHYQTQLASFGNISGDEFKDRLADCTITEKMVASEYYFVTGVSLHNSDISNISHKKCTSFQVM